MANRVHYEDLVIDLYILENLTKGGGRKKIAKILFMIEETSLRNNMIFARYIMQKYRMGPYSPRIATNLENLTKNGFLNLSNRYQSNNNTNRLLKEIEELFQEYSTVFNSIDSIISEFGDFSGDQLANYIYGLPEIGLKKKNFWTYRNWEYIINPGEIKNPEFIFLLNDAWYDTLDILLNPKKLQSLQHAINDCRVGNFTL